MKHSLRAICLSLALIFLCLPLCACQKEEIPPLRQGAMRLSLNSKSDYRVVISDNANDDVRKMAEEFVSYFEKITGCKLPIATDATPAEEKEFIIGKTCRTIDSAIPYDTLGKEGYATANDGATIVMSGNTDRAVAYAVYGFIEQRFGVRYLSAEYEYIPEKPTLDVSQKLTDSSAPAFNFRTLEGAGAADPVFGVKLRLNSRQSLGSENYVREFFVGGGIGYADWFVHTITKLAEMPDKDENGNYNTAQPCLTDETVYQTVLKNVRAWLEKYPDANIVSISQNDGGDEKEMCSCDRCTELYNKHGKVQSAKWVWFVSKIANELKDEYPDVYFDTLAYSFTMLAPTGLQVPDNVIIRLAPIGICYEHGALSCADERAPTRAQRISAKLQFALNDWSNVAKNIYVWDYDALFANYLAPLANFDAVYENIQMFYANGINGFFMQGSEDAPFSELYTYLTSKLMWDPTMSKKEFDAHKREFCKLYYGSDEPILDYESLLRTETQKSHFSTHAIVCRDYLVPSFYRDEAGTHLDTTLIDKMKDCFVRAANAAQTDEQRTHVRRAATQVKYYELVCLFTLEELHADAVLDRDARHALAEELYADMKACGLNHLYEGGALPDNPNLELPPLQWKDSAPPPAIQY